MLMVCFKIRVHLSKDFSLSEQLAKYYSGPAEKQKAACWVALQYENVRAPS